MLSFFAGRRDTQTASLSNQWTNWDQCFVSSNWDFIFDPGRTGDVNVFRIRSDGKKNPMVQLLVEESRGREEVILRMMLTHVDSWN